MITIDIYTILLSILTLVGTTSIGFYLNHFLVSRAETRNLKEKLERIAGKHAKILFNAGGGLQEFTIEDFDKQGVVIKNELQTVFVPTKKLLETEMILPNERYEELKFARMKRDMEKTFEIMMPAIFEKMMPALMNAVREDIIQDEGEVSVVIGMKIAKVLRDSGIEIKQKGSLSK